MMAPVEMPGLFGSKLGRGVAGTVAGVVVADDTAGFNAEGDRIGVAGVVDVEEEGDEEEAVEDADEEE